MSAVFLFELPRKNREKADKKGDKKGTFFPEWIIV